MLMSSYALEEMSAFSPSVEQISQQRERSSQREKKPQYYGASWNICPLNCIDFSQILKGKFFSHLCRRPVWHLQSAHWSLIFCTNPPTEDLTQTRRVEVNMNCCEGCEELISHISIRNSLVPASRTRNVLMFFLLYTIKLNIFRFRTDKRIHLKTSLWVLGKRDK